MRIPIVVSDYPVLLVSTGPVPRVWLSAPTGPNTPERRFIVDDNRSVSPAVIVSLELKEAMTIVQLGGEVIVSARCDANELVVDRMDLRQLGLDLRVAQGVLTVGNSPFSGNRFSNLAVGIALNVVQAPGSRP